MGKRRVGIVGFGKLGQYLATKVVHHPELELAFIWNRSAIAQDLQIPEVPVLGSLDECFQHRPDLIVEVAHPKISLEWGERFLRGADYMVGSPTVFADDPLRRQLLSLAKEGEHGLYLPQGAMIGLQDLLMAARAGRVAELHLAMEKTPCSIHYHGPDLETPLDQITNRQVIYDGPVGPLCQYAPNNVNTMAVATLASGLEFDQVQAKLVVDPSLKTHIVKVEAIGEGPVDSRFRLSFQKDNPAAKGAVTGQATYDSFFQSIIRASGQKSGLHFC